MVSLRFPEEYDYTPHLSKIQERVQSNPFTQAWNEAFDLAMIDEDGNSSHVSRRTFKLTDEPVTVAAVLDELSLLGFSSVLDFESEADLEATTLDLLKRRLIDRGTKGDDGRITHVEWKITDGLIVGLVPEGISPLEDEITDTSWKIRITKRADALMQETANQSNDSKCEAFINRPTGQELIKAMESASLTFSPGLESFILTGHSTEFDDRYGGSYTQISRELAKMVQDGDKSRLHKLFQSSDNDGDFIDKVKKLTQYESDDPGFNAVKNLMTQILDRDQALVGTDPKVTSSRIHFVDGACFDVTSYYVQAAEMWDELRKTTRFGLEFLEKTHGAHTFLSTAPVEFNGITLPKGSLFKQEADGTLAFLRFTPFMFDERKDMVSAFGTEVIKAEQNRGSIEAVQRLMGYTPSSLDSPRSSSG